MPKASGKIDGTTVTSASGSRCTRWRCSSGPVKSVRGGASCFERRAVRAEADDDEPRVDVAHRRRAEPARPSARSASRSRRRSARRRRGTPRAARRCRRRAAARCPAFGGSLRASSIRSASASSAALRRELVDVDARRDLEHALDLADDVFEHLGGCAASRRTSPPPARASRAAPRLELGPAAHRVLELGAVRLDAERSARRGADRPAHQHVVREHEVGGQQLAQRGRVRLDVRALLVCR